MSKKTSTLGPIHHKLFLRKSSRRKTYRSIKEKLAEFGVAKDQVDEAIDLIRQGKVKIADASLVRDVNTLLYLDKEIARLQNIIDSAKAEKQLEG